MNINVIANRKRGMVLLGLLFSGCCSTLLIGGAPAHSKETAANTVISSTASATYSDPDSSGLTIEALSNTVTVTVAEVAGVTVGAGPITDTAARDTGSILPGDAVLFDFVVTNIGNAADTFALPGAATVTGNGTAGTLQYSLDGTSFTPIPAGGLTATAAVPTGGTIIVRVPVTISGGAVTGDLLKVCLGNTGANTNGSDTQNVAYPDASSGNDLYTLSTTAQNGQREASFVQNATVGSQPQALVLVFLTRTNFTQGTVPTADTLTYGLALKVSSTLPTGPNVSHALTAADLAPTAIKLNGSSSPQVLISNAVPLGTALTSVAAPPAGWSTVYTTTPTTTTANDALWATTAPADLASVTRIGFISPALLPKGSSVTGFSYVVTTVGASATAPTPVCNLAQVFGQTAGDTFNTVVYDESGDQNPSGFSADGSRGPTTIPAGVANPAVDSTDLGNNNTAAGSGGDNMFIPVSPAAILNGPNGHPEATGPTGSDDDFTNLSVPIALGTSAGSTVAPPAVTFTNTLRNPGTLPLGGNILLLPLPPAVLSDLPAGVTVTLTCSGQTAAYSYTGTAWIQGSGVAISLPSLAGGESLNYTVVVQLPAVTPLSTDSGRGFPVTIQALVDTHENGKSGGANLGNCTIERLYTGFLRVTQLARIVAADGVTVIQDYSNGPISVGIHAGQFIDYQITCTNISSEAKSGAGSVPLTAAGATIIEDGASGANNWALVRPTGVLLTSNVVGSAHDSGGGVVTFYNGNTAVPGSDKSGTTPAADVTQYIDTVADSLAPGESRTFTFRRKIN